ncbi:prolyl oligopeptidase family serine peptidase [Candidatus Uabimicrobium sp. HlEnr_7]|uniref:prolyl oligopeptidase family serine peptidase n=1 Tax=Candidatus Uabimicrobium helgolandensis TaxID=3095367 RepID=UPI00355736CD
MKRIYCILSLFFFISVYADQSQNTLQLLDVFELEYASDPQISPDGKTVAYTHNSMDIMNDRKVTQIWTVDIATQKNLPLLPKNTHSPRWSPDGKRLLYTATEKKSTQLYVKWLDDGKTVKITHVNSSPHSASWSADGKSIAFLMFIKKSRKNFIQLPSKPQGAKWAKAPIFIDSLRYRFDGGGYAQPGSQQIFVVPSSGGTARQLTSELHDHEGPLVWNKNKIIYTYNENSEEPSHSNIYELDVKNSKSQKLTTRKGPDYSPAISSSGEIAYLGFDDKYKGYQITNLYLLSSKKNLTKNLDRSISKPTWDAAGKGIYFLFNDLGQTKIGYLEISTEKITTVVDNVGGLSLGRPYSSGDFSIAADNTIVYTLNRSDRPADLALAHKKVAITNLNDDLLAHKNLGKVEEVWFASSHDKRKIQGWIVKPPQFDPNKKYPLILEIHGGPFASYGPHFAMELQLYAAAGYVVLYINPRGSTSYGDEFANLIHHNYPGEDYDDLMSGVDFIINQGYVDDKNLFVTGGSGGGVLSAWIVGKTNRFSAAVVAKPVINWYSFVLTADAYDYFCKYWFPGFPWEHPEHYMKRSPLSLVGNVVTPTMLLTGELDYRTPISESEQFYQALKLRNIDCAMVRIPEASHGIARRPSYLMSKVAYILGWFAKYQKD